MYTADRTGEIRTAIHFEKAAVELARTSTKETTEKNSDRVCLVGQPYDIIPAKQTRSVQQSASCRPRKSPSAPKMTCPAIMPRIAAELTRLSSVVDSDGYIFAMIFSARPTLTLGDEKGRG